MLSRRAGPETQPHAVANLFERTRRGLPFQFVHIHVRIYLNSGCRSGDPALPAAHI
jgi:hypothetical protein